MRVSKTSPIVTALVLPVLCYALPQTRTLYDVIPSGEPPSISASFVSTNAAGATVWAIDQVISTVVVDDVSTTFTSNIPATTLIGTAVEDAKTFIYSYIPENTLDPLAFPAVLETCGISASDGDCTALAWIGTETGTVTFTGAVVPIFTETQAAGAAATITSGTSTESPPATTSASGTGTGSPKATATTTPTTGSGTSKNGAATNQIAIVAVIMGVIGCILTL